MKKEAATRTLWKADEMLSEKSKLPDKTCSEVTYPWQTQLCGFCHPDRTGKDSSPVGRVIAHILHSLRGKSISHSLYPFPSGCWVGAEAARSPAAESRASATAALPPAALALSQLSPSPGTVYSQLFPHASFLVTI